MTDYNIFGYRTFLFKTGLKETEYLNHLNQGNLEVRLIRGIEMIYTKHDISFFQKPKKKKYKRR